MLIVVASMGNISGATWTRPSPSDSGRRPRSLGATCPPTSLPAQRGDRAAAGLRHADAVRHQRGTRRHCRCRRGHGEPTRADKS